MTDIYRYSFDQAAVSLIAEIAGEALKEAKRLRISLAANDAEARHLLAKRIIRAIEAGETDILRLRDTALLPTLGRKSTKAPDGLKTGAFMGHGQGFRSRPPSLDTLSDHEDPDDKGVIPAPVIRTRNVFRIVNGSPFFGLLTLIEEVGGTLPLFKLTR
jgi:hypothetical protein